MSNLQHSTDNVERVLTDRQQRELDYHREYAEAHKDLLNEPFDFGVVEEGPRRWWNQYWSMFTYLLEKDLVNKEVLVIGCGFGEDALNLAKVGANVKAFDLSPESLELSRKRAAQEGFDIEFKEMIAESMDYEDDYFDVIVARDILHHVEISKTFSEIIRVAKPGGTLCFNEIYSHSILRRVRYSKFVDKWLYPKLISIVYGSDKPYITEDEMRLTEKEVNVMVAKMVAIEERQYFNAVVTRLMPDGSPIISKIDRGLLRLLSPIGHVLGSRVLVGGVIK